MNSVKHFILICAFSHVFIARVTTQKTFFQNNEPLDDQDLEGIHPKADWRDVISETADTLWCETRLNVKALWCAGTTAYEWLQINVKQTDRNYCCYMYATNRCIAAAAKQMCSQPDIDRMDRLLETKNEQLKSGKCQAYGYQWYDWKSWKCQMPVIPLCLALIVLLVTIKLMYKLRPTNVYFGLEL